MIIRVTHSENRVDFSPVQISGVNLRNKYKLKYRVLKMKALSLLH